jgi:hypothetical protein
MIPGRLRAKKKLSRSVAVATKWGFPILCALFATTPQIAQEATVIDENVRRHKKGEKAPQGGFPPRDIISRLQ